MIACSKPSEVVKSIYKFHCNYNRDDVDYDDDLDHDFDIDNFDYVLTKYTNEIDIVSVYRLSLECLNRIATKGSGEEVVRYSFQFVVKTLELFIKEVDIVVLGLKLGEIK